MPPTSHKDSDSELEELVDAVNGAAAAAVDRELLKQHDRLVRLESLLDTGLMLLNLDGEVRLANQRAREMFQLGEQDWSDVGAMLDKLIAAARAEDETCEVEIEPGGLPLRATVTSCENGASRLVELRDGRALAGIEKDLLSAARVRNLIRLYVGLTHDLKAPLNGMTLHLELLRRDLRRGPETVGGDGMEPLKRLDVVVAELNRLQRSLNRLLEQAVPGATGRQNFDLGLAVSELGDLLSAPARQEGKRIEIELPERAATVAGERDAIKQALLNVAINGLEAMSSGGRLRLRLVCDDDRARVEISDTGPGVDDEVRERLFDIYVTDKSSGIGAGLFFARSLLEAQEGSIELTSTSSSGTTFTVELPLADES